MAKLVDITEESDFCLDFLASDAENAAVRRLPWNHVAGLAFPIILSAVCALVGASRASAMWIRDDRRLEIDPQEAVADSLPPGVPRASVRVVIRGKQTPEAERSNACGDPSGQSGFVVFDVAPPVDDRTRDLDLGYVFELVSGALPAGMEFPPFPVRSSWDAWPVMYEMNFVAPVLLHWEDGNEEPQDAFQFEVRIAAVDRGGNVGAYSAPIVVSDSGRGS
ncbi:MAG: hypothetical protein H6682_18605 [Candidatus Eisenbacteria bacterium]|nr:hypothetical protein [Candidatus Eisenbacteria bacterium]